MPANGLHVRSVIVAPTHGVVEHGPNDTAARNADLCGPLGQHQIQQTAQVLGRSVAGSIAPRTRVPKTCKVGRFTTDSADDHDALRR